MTNKRQSQNTTKANADGARKAGHKSGAGKRPTAARNPLPADSDRLNRELMTYNNSVFSIEEKIANINTYIEGWAREHAHILEGSDSDKAFKILKQHICHQIPLENFDSIEDMPNYERRKYAGFLHTFITPLERLNYALDRNKARLNE